MSAPFRTGFVAAELPSTVAWRTSELRILDQFYPVVGLRGVLPQLPNRTRAAVKQRAWMRGLRSPLRHRKGASDAS